MAQPQITALPELTRSETTAADERVAASFRLDRLASVNALVRAVPPLPPRSAPTPVLARVRNLD